VSKLSEDLRVGVLGAAVLSVGVF